MTQLVPVRVGDVQVLVEALAEPVPRPVPEAVDVGDRVVDLFDRAAEAIVAVAGRVGELAAQIGTHAAPPSGVEVAFGVNVTAGGHVVLASSGVGASLTVTLVWGEPRP